jgi:ATP-dependent helicase/nuclease subunit A
MSPNTFDALMQAAQTPSLNDSAIPGSYLAQLALYRVAVARLFDGRPVNCAILWTIEPKLTILSPRLLDEAAAAA